MYFAGFDFGTATTSVGVELAVAALDPTTIADNAERAIAGIRADTVEWAGLYDDSTLSPDVAGSLVIGSNTNNVFSVHIGTTTGNVAYVGTAIMFAAKAGGGVKDLVYQEAAFKPDGSWDRGKTHVIRTVFTADTDSGSIDNGASSTAGFKWYIHVFSYSGVASSTISLQDGTNGATFVSVDSTSISTRTSSVKTSTGTLRRYTRLFIQPSGTLSVAIALVRV